MSEDVYGRSCPLAFMLTSNDSSEIYAIFLRVVKQAIGVEFQPTCFFVDKDMKEIRAIETVFPTISIRLCDWHRNECWRRWIVNGSHKIPNEYQNTILDSLRQMGSAPTQVEFDTLWKSLHECLVRLGNGPNGRWAKLTVEYIRDEWISCKKIWSHHCFGVDRLLFPTTTNNSIERAFRTFKYTIMSGHKNRRVDDLIDVCFPRADAYFHREHMLRTFDRESHDRLRDQIGSRIDKAVHILDENLIRHSAHDPVAKSLKCWVGSISRPDSCTFDQARRPASANESNNTQSIEVSQAAHRCSCHRVIIARDVKSGRPGAWCDCADESAFFCCHIFAAAMKYGGVKSFDLHVRSLRSLDGHDVNSSSESDDESDLDYEPSSSTSTADQSVDTSSVMGRFYEVLESIPPEWNKATKSRLCQEMKHALIRLESARQTKIRRHSYMPFSSTRNRKSVPKSIRNEQSAPPTSITGLIRVTSVGRPSSSRKPHALPSAADLIAKLESIQVPNMT